MGVTGAAVATVIGQCVAAVVAFTCNHKYNHEVKLIFRGFRPSGRIIGTIYAIGIPSIIMQSIGSVMTYSMNLHEPYPDHIFIYCNCRIRSVFQTAELFLHACLRFE